MPMVIHKRAIEKISASKIRKQREGLRDFVFVIYLHKLPFTCILDFTDKKSWIPFQVQRSHLLLLTISVI